MKNILLISSISLFFVIGMTLTSCHDHKHGSGTEYTSAYICPMHCKGSGSAEAGKCPVCKMDYVKNTKAKDHDHDTHLEHDHDGHDDDGHDDDGHDH